MESEDDNHNQNIVLNLKAYLRKQEFVRRCAFVRFKLLL